MCILICVGIYIYIYTDICMHIEPSTHIYIYTCIPPSMAKQRTWFRTIDIGSVGVVQHVCVLIHTYIYIYVYISIYTRVYTCIYTCIHTYMYKTMYILRRAQGFEQLSLGLWELFKISGNRPASHHLLLPRLRDLWWSEFCNTLQHAATHCHTQQHTATRFNTTCLVPSPPPSSPHSMIERILQQTATRCNTLQHHQPRTISFSLFSGFYDRATSATSCDTLHHATTHCHTLEDTATRYRRRHHLLLRLETRFIAIQWRGSEMAGVCAVLSRFFVFRDTNFERERKWEGVAKRGGRGGVTPTMHEHTNDFNQLLEPRSAKNLNITHTRQGPQKSQRWLPITQTRLKTPKITY